jgi:excisionase family DNA binding protein
METIAASVNDTARALGVGRTKVYQLLAEKKLEAVKIGRRTLIKADSIRALVDA